MSQSYIPRTAIPMALAVATLFTYNFLGANWSPAPANPPLNNKSAPINVATSTQSTQWGFGALGFDKFVAFDRVNSNLYCDRNGNNCFTPGSTTMPVCTGSDRPVAVDVIESSMSNYAFDIAGLVKIYLIGAGGSGGAAAVDSGRESVATGGGGGGTAIISIDDAKTDLGTANFTIGQGGSPVSGSGSGYYSRGEDGENSVFSSGSYVVTAGGGQAGRASNVGGGSWNYSTGASGGIATANASALTDLWVQKFTGGASSEASTGYNAHKATGGASPNLNVGAHYNGYGVNDQRGAESFVSSISLNDRLIASILKSGGKGSINTYGGGGDEIYSADEMKGGPGAGGGGYATEQALATSGAGGDGLAMVYYYNCRVP